MAADITAMLSDGSAFVDELEAAVEVAKEELVDMGEISEGDAAGIVVVVEFGEVNLEEPVISAPVDPDGEPIVTSAPTAAPGGEEGEEEEGGEEAGGADAGEEEEEEVEEVEEYEIIEGSAGFIEIGMLTACVGVIGAAMFL
jgi:hypothetical protein